MIKGFKSKGQTIAVFNTYLEARQAAEEYYLGQKLQDFTVNRITIEDRLSGELYEATKTYFPETGKMIEDYHEELSYTKKILGEKFR